MTDQKLPRVTVRRVEVREIVSEALVRTFHCDLPQLPEWFRPALEYAQPVLGSGVIDPLELRIDGSRMTSISPGFGKTLVEHFHTNVCPEPEESARELVEELCCAVARLHFGQERVHGALTPLNVCTNGERQLRLWSVPTARLELSYRDPDKEWEVPFRSPRVNGGETPETADDLYALGKLLARLLCGTESNFLSWNSGCDDVRWWSSETDEIITRCLHGHYSTVKELAAELSPKSKLPNLDIATARHHKMLALQAFELARFEEAQEHWEEARHHDRLDLAVHNNAGVTKAATSQWEDALEHLERAQEIYGYHPVVDTNLALCKHHLKDQIDCHFRIRRTISLNPNFAQSHRLQAQLAFESGATNAASESILQALRSNPRCRRSRLLAAEILGALGDKSEAETHRKYAQKLSKLPDLLDHLITEATPPPWTLYLEGQDNTLFHRVNLVKWPRLPIEDFWRWLYEGGKI